MERWQHRREAALRALNAARVPKLDEDEKARRREATRRLRAFRDSQASIAPDTTGDYIRTIRDANDRRE